MPTQKNSSFQFLKLGNYTYIHLHIIKILVYDHSFYVSFPM